jgi:chromosome segregation ATPase
MGIEILAQLLGALGGLAGMGAILNWWVERRKRRAAGTVAELSIGPHVQMNNVASLQAQLAYLEKIIKNISEHNDKLQQEIEDAEDRSRRQNARIRELEEEVALVRTNARTLQHQCDELERKLNQLTTD